jgi:membrane fusion protein (multidrug efflux system)
MKTLGILLLALLCLPATAMAGQKAPTPAPAKVVLAPVEEKMVAQMAPIVGVLYFDKVSGLSTEVSGLITSARFREGDRVNEGDVLLKLNTDFIDKDIEMVRTKIEQMAIRIEKAEKDLERYEKLHHNKAIREKDYDDIRFTHLDRIKEREVLKKQLEIALLKKAKSVIRAPFDGIVLEKCADVGDWIEPGAELCRIGSIHDIFVKVPVAEELTCHSPHGGTVDVTINATGNQVSGRIAGVLPLADPRTKNCMIKIRLPRLETIVENMSATVLIPVGERRRLKLVPRDALVRFEGKDMVYTVKGGHAVAVPIHIVSFSGEYACTDSPDISQGMKVVVDGNERLQPRQPVIVIKNPSQGR